MVVPALSVLNNRGCGKKNVKEALLSKVLGLVSLIAGAAVLLDVIDELGCGVHPYFEQAGLKILISGLGGSALVEE